jgi:hypothetical protein
MKLNLLLFRKFTILIFSIIEHNNEHKRGRKRGKPEHLCWAYHRVKEEA